MKDKISFCKTYFQVDLKPEKIFKVHIKKQKINKSVANWVNYFWIFKTIIQVKQKLSCDSCISQNKKKIFSIIFLSAVHDKYLKNHLTLPKQFKGLFFFPVNFSLPAKDKEN